MAIDPAQMIDAIASKQMGVDPATPPTPPAPAQAAPQPAEKDTPTDKATEAAAPADPSQKMVADPILYEIDMGDGKKRKMTPEQIKGVTERYSALNHKHAQFKPVLSIVEAMLEQNPNATPEHVAAFMMSALKGGQSNPQMGDPNADKGRQNQTSEAEIDPLSKWEQENAATLPPGYREMMQGNQSVAQQLQQVQQMLAQVLATGAGVADAARVGQQDARQTQIAAIQRSIANNVDRAQAALQLPDSEAENFMTFAAERGYALEDFVDPNLTITVMRDFKNAMNSPEFERLAEINKRRQAWTGGALSQSPAAPDGKPAAEGTGNAMFDNLTNSVVSRRLSNG